VGGGGEGGGVEGDGDTIGFRVHSGSANRAIGEQRGRETQAVVEIVGDRRLWVVARTRYQDDWVFNLYRAMQAAILASTLVAVRTQILAVIRTAELFRMASPGGKWTL